MDDQRKLWFPADTMRVEFRGRRADPTIPAHPAIVHDEFIVPLAGDVDARCACRFIEFTEPDDREQGAVFAWNRDCPIHKVMPARRWLDEAPGTETGEG